ncbi:MAG: sulfate transporter CysZ [Gammaproteobacteria bacterium]|nr:sulfate transporter CysZ [Gammaproteobacteria bacterium]
MISNPVTGAGYLLRGLTLLNKPRVRRFVILPLLINIVLFVAALWLAADYFGSFIDHLMPELPSWLAWLSWLLWLVFAAAAVVIVFFGFTLVANLVGAPFNGYLAEAVEYHLTGQRPPGSDKSFLAEAKDAILGELKKYVYFILWAIPLLILFVIPVVNLIAPFAWLVFGAWMLTIEYADYPMGNHGLTFPDQRRRLAEKKFLNLGYGAAVMVGTMVPLFNFLVMPTAVAGATALWVEQLRRPGALDNP